MTSERKIIHIDMDCFYAAVEVKHRPELKGKPIGIGGPPDSRSVLCTANYEARQFGVRAAIPSSRAVRLCPQLILIPPNFHLYKTESRAVRQILDQFTDKVEPLSLDEAYLDVTGSAHFSGSATKIAEEIRRRIESELQLTASAGIANNKFLAKIASDWRKPNGQFVIRPQDVEAFMPKLKVEKIFGVGKVTAKRMHELGLATCRDIQLTPLEKLTAWFGSRAPELRELAFGRDHRPVHTHEERKSLTVEETFSVDRIGFKDWQRELPGLYQDWSERMSRVNDGSQIRGYVVKVKFQDFKSMTREMAGREWPTLEVFTALLLKVWNERPEPIRLLGLGVRLGPQASNGRMVGARALQGGDDAQLRFSVDQPD
jgi:DNA polymerase-4